MGGGIDPICPGTENRYRTPAVQRAGVSCTVYTDGQTAGNRQAASGETASERARGFDTRRSRVAATHDGKHWGIENSWVPAYKQQKRRCAHLCQLRRIKGIIPRQDVHAFGVGPGQIGICGHRGRIQDRVQGIRLQAGMLQIRASGAQNSTRIPETLD
jgi:hypothetical protein